MEYRIITDGCCDLDPETVKRYDLHVIPFYISFDEENYFLENHEITLDEIYERMVKNPDVYPKTSLPSIQNYIDEFEPYVSGGIPLIYIAFNSIMSGAYNCACNARDMILEDHPEAKLTVIDSCAVTVTQGLLVLEALKAQQSGASYEECIDLIDRMKMTNRIFYTVGDVEYLKHGGRIGKLAGMAATTLSLKPLITVDKGEILPSGIGRSRKKTLNKTFVLLEEYFKNNGDSLDDYAFCVGYGYDLEEAKQYLEKAGDFLEARSNIKREDILSLRIGPAVSIHNGPYALGIGCIKRYDRI